MTIGIMQPYAFPYIGYFQLIASVDRFLLLDDVNYINKGWINRNRLLINKEPQYFVLPISRASQNKTINSLQLVQDNKWKSTLEKTLSMAYGRSKNFTEFFSLFKQILSLETWHLSDFIACSLQTICNYLEIKTEIVTTTAGYFNSNLKGQDRIIDLCEKEHASTYINASGGKTLYESAKFEERGIQLKFINPNLRPYDQNGTDSFVPGLSIIDMLMNCPKPLVQKHLNDYTFE